MKKIFYYYLILLLGFQLTTNYQATAQIFGSGANPNNYSYKGKNFTQERVNAITKYTPYFQAVLLIIAIIGMVGAFRIYVRWQNGEEVYSDIVRWGMAGLIVPIAYVIFSKFFLNT